MYRAPEHQAVEECDHKPPDDLYSIRARGFCSRPDGSACLLMENIQGHMLFPEKILTAPLQEWLWKKALSSP
jgi:hypothetical protein